MIAAQHLFREASAYTFGELAEIYNQTRVDYIVPMPMNAKRMADYVNDYDVDLRASIVALNDDMQPCGVIMSGFRGERSWVTRLGIIPDRRGHKVGQGLMETSIRLAKERNVRRIQLEVIKGNKPAYCLFVKLGFVEVRELMVIRRPPILLAEDLVPADATVAPITAYDIPDFLAQRENSAAWTEETPSLLHSGQLHGFYIKFSSGETGWIIFKLAPFQLSHIVLSPGASNAMAHALIYCLHRQLPAHDTQIENVPRLHSAWPILQKVGYFEVFSRIEMSLNLY